MIRPAEWQSRRVVLFGGKGGVGKTTCATAFALLAARAGRRTLLVSTDPSHSTSDILEQSLGEAPTRVQGDLWAMEIDPEQETLRYIEQVRAQLLTVVPPKLREEVDRQVEMARVSPGAEEAALFDRIAELIRQPAVDHELVVFDTAPTGHTLRLLTLPELMQAWIDGLLQRRRQVSQLAAMWRHMTVGGAPEDEEDPVERTLLARRRKFFQVRQTLLDADASLFLFVLNAERLPILETRKALTLLERHGVPVGGLLVNRVLPEAAEEHPFLAARKRQEREYLEEIDATFPTLPRIRLPLLPHDVVGREALQRVADALAEQLR